MLPPARRPTGVDGPGPPVARAAGDHTAHTGVSSPAAPTGHRPTSSSPDPGPGQRTPSPSISFLGLPSRPSALHLVRSRNEINVCGTRSTYEKRDQDLDNEIDVPGTSLSPPSRPSTFPLVPQPSISFVHATRSTCEERDRRARDEIDVRGTRSTCEGREQDLGNEIDAGPRRVLRAPRPDAPILARARGPSAGAHRWRPHGGHQPRPPSTPQPRGARSPRTPPSGSNTQVGHVRAVDTPGSRAPPPRGHRHPRSVETPLRRPRP